MSVIPFKKPEPEGEDLATKLIGAHDAHPGKMEPNTEASTATIAAALASHPVAPLPADTSAHGLLTAIRANLDAHDWTGLPAPMDQLITTEVRDILAFSHHRMKQCMPDSLRDFLSTNEDKLAPADHKAMALATLDLALQVEALKPVYPDVGQPVDVPHTVH